MSSHPAPIKSSSISATAGFPFFLFIMGVSMTLSFARRQAKGDARAALIRQIVRRTCTLR